MLFDTSCAIDIRRDFHINSFLTNNGLPIQMVSTDVRSESNKIIFYHSTWTTNAINIIIFRLFSFEAAKSILIGRGRNTRDSIVKTVLRENDQLFP